MKFNRLTLILFLLGLGTTINSFSQDSNEENKINQVLEKKRSYNRKNKTTKGYKIQLYNGNETKAYSVKDKYIKQFGNSAELLYESPEWKVRIGNYKTKLEADRALLAINKKFNGAIIVITEIDL